MGTIRNQVNQPKIAPTQPNTVAPQQEQPGLNLEEIAGEISRALSNDGRFSQTEEKKLETTLKGAPPEFRAQVGEAFKKALADYEKASGKQVDISDVALSKLSRLLGTDFKGLFFERQRQSAQVDPNVSVTQGLEKTAESTAQSHDADVHKSKSAARLDKHKAVLDGKKGVVDRPVGGVKGQSYDAGRILGEHVEQKLDARLPPEAKAAKDVLREPLIKGTTAVLAEMQKGDTLKKIGDVFTGAGTIGEAASAVSESVANALNIGVNADNVTAAAGATVGAVEKITKAAQGTRFEGVVAQHGGKIVKGVTDLAAKATSGAKAVETAAVATKTAQAASATANVVKGAQAATVAVEGAQVAAAGTQAAAGVAKAGAQEVPVVGQILGVATTGMALVETVSHIAHKPRDWKRIFASAANTIGQAVGIFVPFVGGATTLAKLAADAAMNANDKRHGKETHTPGIAGAAQHLGNVTGMASPFLEGAGYGDAALKLREYSSVAAQLGEKGLTSTDLARMNAAEREAMLQMMSVGHQEMEKLKDEAKGTPYEAAAHLMGQAFLKVMGLFKKSKNVDTAENPEAEVKKQQGEAVEALNHATAGLAVANDEAEKAKK